MKQSLPHLATRRTYALLANWPCIFDCSSSFAINWARARVSECRKAHGPCSSELVTLKKCQPTLLVTSSVSQSVILLANGPSFQKVNEFGSVCHFNSLSLPITFCCYLAWSGLQRNRSSDANGIGPRLSICMWVAIKHAGIYVRMAYIVFTSQDTGHISAL